MRDKPAIKKNTKPIGQLTGVQVRATWERSGLAQAEFAAEVGCSRAQLNRYFESGLPPRMNNSVRRNLLAKATELGVLKTAEAEAGVFL